VPGLARVEPLGPLHHWHRGDAPHFLPTAGATQPRTTHHWHHPKPRTYSILLLPVQRALETNHQLQRVSPTSSMLYCHLLPFLVQPTPSILSLPFTSFFLCVACPTKSSPLLFVSSQEKKVQRGVASEFFYLNSSTNLATSPS